MSKGLLITGSSRGLTESERFAPELCGTETVVAVSWGQTPTNLCCHPREGFSVYTEPNASVPRRTVNNGGSRGIVELQTASVQVEEF